MSEHENTGMSESEISEAWEQLESFCVTATNWTALKGSALATLDAVFRLKAAIERQQKTAEMQYKGMELQGLDERREVCRLRDLVNERSGALRQARERMTWARAVLKAGKQKGVSRVSRALTELNTGLEEIKDE